MNSYRCNHDLSLDRRRIYSLRCTDFSNVSVGLAGRKQRGYPRLARTAQACVRFACRKFEHRSNQNRLRDTPIYRQISRLFTSRSLTLFLRRTVLKKLLSKVCFKLKTRFRVIPNEKLHQIQRKWSRIK